LASTNLAKPGCPSHEQLRLLNLLDVTLDDPQNNALITPHLALFLMSELNQHLSYMTTHQDADLVEVTQGVTFLVSILGAFTACGSVDINNLLIEKDLIKIIIQFCLEAEKITSVGPNSPWFAMKSRFMRILANLGFENPKAQDMVREAGGLPLIMTSCIIDDQNPYLREWSILALRNLCLDNDLNQQFVSNLKAQGIPAHIQEEMLKVGIKLSLGEDGKVKFTRGDKK